MVESAEKEKEVVEEENVESRKDGSKEKLEEPVSPTVRKKPQKPKVSSFHLIFHFHVLIHN